MVPKRPRAGSGPAPAYSTGRTLLATVLLVGAIPTALLAVAAPVAVLATAALALIGVAAARAVGRRLRRRRRGRSGGLCVPRTDVCVPR